MIKEGADHHKKVRACCLHEPQIGAYAWEVPQDQWTKAESGTLPGFDFEWNYGLHATDYEKQKSEWDPVLWPARMEKEILEQLPMTFVMTSEFCFLRRDSIEFSKRLMGVGKLIGLQDYAGYDHGWSFCGTMPDTDRFWKEW